MSVIDARVAVEHDAVPTHLDGIDVPVSLLTSLQKETRGVALAIYRRTAEEVAMASLKANEQTEKTKEQQQKALEAAQQLPLEEVLRRGLKEILKKKPGHDKTVKMYDDGADVVDFAKMIGVNVNDPTLNDDKSAKLESKNGKSPGGARGHSTIKARGKGRGAGRGSRGNGNSGTAGAESPGKGNGKGNGKGKGKSPGKGKGKGKQDGKTGRTGKGGGKPKGKGKH